MRTLVHPEANWLGDTQVKQLNERPEMLRSE